MKVPGAAAALAASGPALLVVVWIGSRWRERRRRLAAPATRQVPRSSWQPSGTVRKRAELVLSVPSVLDGVPVGSCVARWSSEYLAAVAGDLKVSVHVAETRSLDFARKNFRYEVMTLRDFLQRAREALTAGIPLYYYFRSQHAKRNKASTLEAFGPLADDFQLPQSLLSGFAVHSTVLRIASPGLRMWLHYDVCDNFLCCVRGRKRVALLPPSAVSDMYLHGSSSALGSRALEEDAKQQDLLWREFPLAEGAWARRQEVVLEEGSLLFIPALWLHCTEALPAADAKGGGADLCVSLNLFLVRTEHAALHDPKDVWANRDLLPAQEATKLLEERVTPKLRQLPSEHCAFHCRKAAAELLAMAEEAEKSGQLR